jgi:LysM repeat protein
VRTPILRWLSFRIRILCGVILLISSILPPFVPRAALSADENAVPASQFLLVEDGFLMKSSTIGEQASRLAFSDVIIHKVKNGETIGDIARQYNISVDTLMTVNNMQAGTSVQPDQELLILPVDGVLHIVRPGQTLARISELYGVSQDVISRQNNIRGSFIVAGQQLIIPGAKPIGGMVPAIAAIQESTGDSGLHFTDKLPSKDIQLQLKQAEQEGRRPTAGSSVKNAPAVSVEPTTGILQMPCNNCFITQYFHAGHYALDKLALAPQASAGSDYDAILTQEARVSQAQAAVLAIESTLGKTQILLIKNSGVATQGTGHYIIVNTCRFKCAIICKLYRYYLLIY